MYSLTKFGTVRRDADGGEFPADADTLDGANYRAWLAAGNVPSAYVAPPPSVADIERERARRLALGFNYAFPAGDARGTVRIGTTVADMAGWSEVSEWSRTKLALGQTTVTLQVLTNSGPVTVTPMEWQNILDAGSAFRQPLWAASFALEAQNPIPADFAADNHWPAVQ